MLILLILVLNHTMYLKEKYIIVMIMITMNLLHLILKKKGKFTCYELNIYVEGEWSEFGEIMYETPVNIYKLYNIENVIDQKYSKLLLFKGQRKITTYTGNVYLDNVYFVGDCNISYRDYQIINCTKGKLYLSETNEIISEGNYKFNNINNNYSIELNGIEKI